MFDIVIGAQSKDSLITCQTFHGFYGTLRSGGPEAPTISEETVCVADMLYHPGHRLWHVLGAPGWKTELIVDQVTLNDGTQGRPEVISGNIGNVPESFIVAMDLSTDRCYEDFDCGGTHAFALAHEMIQRGNRSVKDKWMKDYILKCNVKEADFDTNRPFDLDCARRDLAKAWKGLSTPNPEYSTNWMLNIIGGMNISDPQHPFFQPSERLAGACNTCRRTSERLKNPLKACARCKNVWYCSRDCQVKDWKIHKKVCFDKNKKKNTNNKK